MCLGLAAGLRTNEPNPVFFTYEEHNAMHNDMGKLLGVTTDEMGKALCNALGVSVGYFYYKNEPEVLYKVMIHKSDKWNALRKLQYHLCGTNCHIFKVCSVKDSSISESPNRKIIPVRYEI